MKILTEKHFELWETHVNISYDSPVKGDSEENEIYKTRLGNYEEVSAAKRRRTYCVKKYQADGYKISQLSTERYCILYDNSCRGRPEIRLFIEEKIISEKIIK